MLAQPLQSQPSFSRAQHFSQQIQHQEDEQQCVSVLQGDQSRAGRYRDIVSVCYRETRVVQADTGILCLWATRRTDSCRQIKGCCLCAI